MRIININFYKKLHFMKNYYLYVIRNINWKSINNYTIIGKIFGNIALQLYITFSYGTQ